jgi:hypothetical protein
MSSAAESGLEFEHFREFEHFDCTLNLAGILSELEISDSLARRADGVEGRLGCTILVIDFITQHPIHASTFYLLLRFLSSRNLPEI